MFFSDIIGNKKWNSQVNLEDDDYNRIKNVDIIAKFLAYYNGKRYHNIKSLKDCNIADEVVFINHIYLGLRYLIFSMIYKKLCFL